MRFLPALAALLTFAAVAYSAPVPAAAVEVDDLSPVWSPDGRRIAFVRVFSTDTERTRAVYLVRADGTGLRRLPNAGSASSAAWSPDGKHVAFAQTVFRGDREISSVAIGRADGSRVRLVAAGSLPAWSPDGGRIAFVRETNIGILDVATRTARLLTNFPRFCSRVGPPCHGGASWLSWSPDGKRLAVALGKRIGVIAASGVEVRFHRLRRAPTVVPRRRDNRRGLPVRHVCALPRPQCLGAVVQQRDARRGGRSAAVVAGGRPRRARLLLA